MAILYLGIDLAKNVFAVHGVNAAGKPELVWPKVARAKLHQAFVEARTATINRLRGLLSESGIVLPQKAEVVRREAAAHLEVLPGDANLVVGDLLSELHRLDERVASYDTHVARIARADDRARRLMQLPASVPRRQAHSWR